MSVSALTAGGTRPGRRRRGMKMRLRLGAKRRASAMKLPRRTAIPPAARERSPVLAMLGPNTIRVSFASRAGTLPHAGSGELVISSGVQPLGAYTWACHAPISRLRLRDSTCGSAPYTAMSSATRRWDRLSGRRREIGTWPAIEEVSACPSSETTHARKSSACLRSSARLGRETAPTSKPVPSLG